MEVIRDPLVSVPIEALRSEERSVWREAYAVDGPGAELALFSVGGGYVAVERYCPHAGADLVRFGYPMGPGGTIVCTAHAHEYDLATGRCVRGDACRALRTYATRTSAGGATLDIIPPGAHP
jgi:nitrite reductase/ring-hydroxylating ferredoxin subunit